MRYNRHTKTFDESDHVETFIDDILDLYEKYGLALSHEDTQGSFIVTTLDESHKNWLSSSMIDFQIKI